jgi:hypothetical protein
MRYRSEFPALSGAARAVCSVALAAAALAWPASANAQSVQSAPPTATAASIDSGMTKAQVIERFGRPAGESSRGTYTYLFYSNGMERAVGMSDLVILNEDRVVDAVLRSPRRTYSGRSSSPKAISAQEAARGKPTPLRTGGDR